MRNKIFFGLATLSLVLAMALSVPFGRVVYITMTQNSGHDVFWLAHSIINPPEWSACIDLWSYMRCAYPNEARLSVYALWVSSIFWILFLDLFIRSYAFWRELGRGLVQRTKEAVWFRIILYIVTAIVFGMAIVYFFTDVFTTPPPPVPPAPSQPPCTTAPCPPPNSGPIE